MAVYAWSFIPPAPLAEPGMLAMPAGDLPGQLDAENTAARDALDVAVELALAPAADVASRSIVEGSAEDALVAESTDADLVVVGSHGRAGFRAALLGSVSRHVTADAACPVVVAKARASSARPASRRGRDRDP